MPVYGVNLGIYLRADSVGSDFYRNIFPFWTDWILVVGVFVSHSVTVVVGRTTRRVRELGGMQCDGVCVVEVNSLRVCVCVVESGPTSRIKSGDK